MKTLKFPESKQAYFYDCGANALQSVLIYYGVVVREEKIMKLAGTKNKGTPVAGMKAAAKKLNLDFKAGKMTVRGIKKYLDRNIPVILLIQAWPGKSKTNWKKDWTDGHYVVAIGYDSKKMYFEDPWTDYRTFLAHDELKKRWHASIYGKKHVNWGMAILGLKNFVPPKPKHMD
jgi:ABC-type bacteriocin/lantibiotic exporter with double-glycine peptidase domain